MKKISYNEAKKPYDYGFTIGKKLNPIYKMIYQMISYNSKSYLKPITKKQLNNLEYYCPSLFEELKGLSDSTKIKLKKLFSIQQGIHGLFGGECTTTASTKEATKQNDTFVTENWDSHILHPYYFIAKNIFPKKIHFCNLENFYKYVFIGVPVLHEIPIFNEYGVGFAGNGTILTSDNKRLFEEGKGKPSFILVRETMMKCKDVLEVANFWKKSLRSSYKHKIFPHHWDYMTSVWCDSNSGILMIEQTHKQILLVFGNSTNITNAPKNILWHSNHHQWLNPNKTGSVYPAEYLPSNLREKRSRSILEKNYGNITIDLCKNLTRDHINGFTDKRKNSGNICRHFDTNSLKATVFAYILEPKKLTAHITPGQPCKNKYIKYNFSNILKQN